ncbi:MAG TPA: histidine kinase [Cellulomonas sp.]|uniref:sensor histidine kinase n=1 Tax=Cellulomonas sp. TaxID=40001 RepID=UPI002E306FBD|nr:histidine kinase [Cellulomonas sp.]HEX5331749.1 histidine kinase [Cellulomonas sp.]
MTRDAVRPLWVEPRALQPPVRVWRDWALVGVFVSAAVLETVLRQDARWFPLGSVEAVALAFTLLWRRTRPLAMIAVGFGVSAVVSLAAVVGHAGGPVAFVSMVYLLLLVYALFRWGSGGAVAIGSLIALASSGLGSAVDHAQVGDALFGVVILAIPAALGASVRLRATTRQRELDQVRLREREQLARELHDTVAHHVSAMVVRAQAGRVVAAMRPGAAVEALEVIEAEGARTLAEMRTMVGVLREPHDAEVVPQRGAADIDRLARPAAADEPGVEVQVSGDLTNLSPSVGAASYRIAQEAVTNATRHARHATRIVVQVAGDRDDVRMTVSDDGDPVTAGRPRGGFGVVGMTERAALLGGTLHAGPGPDRGWVVDAVLPRRGPTR